MGKNIITEQDARDFIMRVLEAAGENVSMNHVIKVTDAVHKAHGTWDFESIPTDAFWQCVADELNAIEGGNIFDV